MGFRSAGGVSELEKRIRRAKAQAGTMKRVPSEVEITQFQMALGPFKSGRRDVQAQRWGKQILS
jgi:hypothetical protein